VRIRRGPVVRVIQSERGHPGRLGPHLVEQFIDVEVRGRSQLDNCRASLRAIPRTPVPGPSGCATARRTGPVCAAWTQSRVWWPTLAMALAARLSRLEPTSEACYSNAATSTTFRDKLSPGYVCH
jgi:hypothetical protein